MTCKIANRLRDQWLNSVHKDNLIQSSDAPDVRERKLYDTRTCTEYQSAMNQYVQHRRECPACRDGNA